MVNIRSNIFETNSSSCHSIVVTGDTSRVSYPLTIDSLSYPIMYRKKKDKKYLMFGDTEYGRSPFMVLRTFFEKLDFVLCSIMQDRVIDWKMELVESICRKYLPFIDGIMFRAYEDEDSWGVVKYYHLFGSNFTDTLYTVSRIDHQSCDLLENFLKDYDIDVFEFLDNNKYIIIIDGDEYLVWDSMKKSGLVDMSKIKGEYGIHGKLG